jgi:phytoene dehydrogenase-like protein
LISDPRADVVIVGGGHNALVAAAYLARAGRAVRVLERLDHVGGAAVSAHAFDGVDARLSRYSYLVSLLPRRIIDDLGVRVRLARRRYSSYTPDPSTGGETGLLVGPNPTFDAIGAAADAEPFAEFYRRARAVTTRLWPTVTSPLMTRDDAFKLVVADGDSAAESMWRAMICQPIGQAITEAVANDLVRGVMVTDALIGTFARADDPSLLQNVCFLYHLVGGGTGEWDVPIGGMGAVSGALSAAATSHGAEISTGADVYAIAPDGEVRYLLGDEEHRVGADRILAGVTPTVLADLVGDATPVTAPGAQVKVNLMLKRLPRLRDETVSPEQAFGGTFHINETYRQLDAAYARASAGSIPDPIPCEIYCHSLTDPSILSQELQASGAQTLTVFGLHAPHTLTRGADPDRLREDLTSAVLHSLNSVLAEPIQDVLMEDSSGRLCIEAKTTLDLERTLGMTAGNIFHGALAWPFVENDEPLDTPARRWGVESAYPGVLLCGSGSRRGGAVSGLGGHNAAMAVLES